MTADRLAVLQPLLRDLRHAEARARREAAGLVTESHHVLGDEANRVWRYAHFTLADHLDMLAAEVEERIADEKRQVAS